MEGLRRYVVNGSMVRRDNFCVRSRFRDNLNCNETRRHYGKSSRVSSFGQDNKFISLNSVYYSAHCVDAFVIYVRGVIVPLVFGATPFFSRQVESALAQTDKGLVEAALSMGSSPFEVIFRVYLRESLAPIIRAITITIISLLGLTAMAGAVGAGGLGDFAIRYGHDRNMIDITWVVVVVLVLGVSVVQWLGETLARKNTH